MGLMFYKNTRAKNKKLVPQFYNPLTIYYNSLFQISKILKKEHIK